ncbi:hypothetical protein IQ250_27365, partial [Pseudanabaenaceae cyanobacterium LEGE 13415]|nr:hypothetical protein [Pseudanabaenaceae cyanobacterium LEGE 13415]
MPADDKVCESSQADDYQFELKSDLESLDDRKLAVAELRSLTGADDDLEFGAATSISIKIPRGVIDISMLRSRLAFWKAARLAQLCSNDRANTDITQSLALEATAKMKPAWKTLGEKAAIPAVEARGILALSDKPSPALRKKNEYLSHPFHKYKAKFFPRLARSLINVTCPDREQIILDPFSGSGTSCVEASLMGMSSIGLDIDPLSVFISKIKANLQDIDLRGAMSAYFELVSSINSGNQASLWNKGGNYEFRLPSFLIKRRPKRLPPELITEIEREIGYIRGEIFGIEEENVKDLFLMVLSHAIATKLSLRWMGTGDDRFALEVATRPLSKIFVSHAKMVIDKLVVYQDLRSAGVVPAPGHASISVAEASKLPLPDELVDGIVTSPPYLPAASGRETYLRSRASSIMALNLMTEKEILDTETRILGSILAKVTVETANVPSDVVELAAWMRPQRERTAKADPTIAYFENLRACLGEMRRVLKRGGRAALVVSKEHTFWELTSRRIIRKFDMSKAVTE